VREKQKGMDRTLEANPDALLPRSVRILESGIGDLIQPLDVEGFREWNRAKNNATAEEYTGGGT